MNRYLPRIVDKEIKEFLKIIVDILLDNCKWGLQRYLLVQYSPIKDQMEYMLYQLCH